MTEMIVREQAEGERRWFAGGGLHIWKLTAEETGGAFFLFEDLLVKGKTTPFHRHPGIDEALYILEGTLRVHVEGVEREVGASSVVLFPRGVAHAFLVTSETARILCLQTPGSGESFYRAASDPGDSGPVDFARLREVATSDPTIDIIGPPPFRR